MDCELPLQGIGLPGVPPEHHDKFFDRANNMAGGGEPEFADNGALGSVGG